MPHTEFDLDVDSDQGNAVFLLDAQEHFEAADLLEIASVSYDWTDENWGQAQYQVYLAVEMPLLPRYTETVRKEIVDALELIHVPDPVGFSGCVAYPKRVEGDWRELRRQGRLTGINNQGTRVPLPDSHPKRHGLAFRDHAEVLVFEAFERAQKRLPEEATILLAPNAGILIGGKPREVDLLVTYRGRVGAIEVDGSTHHKRWAADQSRDRLLLDAGIQVVERIVAEDTSDAAALDHFVQRVLDRLMAR
jgi:hypothetical protein